MSVDLNSVELDDRQDGNDAEAYESYRAMSTLAVASLIAGILSLLAFISWVFGLIPMIGIILGLRARRQIRNNSQDLSGMPLANTGLILSIGFLVAGWSLLGFVYATEVPDGYQRISYEDLQPPPGTEPANPVGEKRVSVSLIPDAARKLDGKKVFIKGYMFPGTPQTEGITQFVLVRDNGACCFGPSGPNLTDMILVTMKGDQQASYESYIRKLAGTFKVETRRFSESERKTSVGQDNVAGVLYQLEAEYLQ
jgi:hypothetical protein